MALESIGAYSFNRTQFPTLGSVPQYVQKPSQQQNERKIYIEIEGKTYALTLEEFKQYIDSVRRQKEASNIKRKPYELGPERNGCRIVDVISVTDPLKPGSSAPTNMDVSPSKLEEYTNNIDNPNGKIDAFKQGKRGDCYLLATIESLNTTTDGKEILTDNIKKNKDESYTVTLPGAIAVKNHYKEMGLEDKCSITGRYTITKAAIEKAQKLSGKSYAYGDIEVILYELAMEALRSEISKTNAAIGIKSERFIAGQIGPISDVDTLESGLTYDAIFLITGQKSDLYEATTQKRQNIKYYIPGEFGYVGEEKKFQKGLIGKAKGIVEIEHYYDKESDLQRMLNQYAGKEDQYSITVSVVVGQNGPDGSTKARGGHALTVCKITEDYVEVINPWDTTKHERIPRGEFEKMAARLNVAPISKDNYDKFKKENNIDQEDNNSSFLNRIFHKILDWLN